MNTTRAIIDALPDLVFRFDRNGTCLDFLGSRKELLFTELPIGKPIGTVLPATVMGHFTRAVADMVVDRKMRSFRYPLEVPAGLRQFEARLSPIDNDELIVIVRDVTEQQAAEDQVRRYATEKETLLKEVQHRVKNNMHAMSNLLGLQASVVSDPVAATALNAASGRFRTMEILYDRLQHADDHRKSCIISYIQELVPRIVGLFSELIEVTVIGSQGEKECICGHPRTDGETCCCLLTERQLSTIGLIINELVTNSMKYAFSDQGRSLGDGAIPGRLTVGVACTDQAVEVVVEDNGPGMPTEHDRAMSGGFGQEMVWALVEQLSGTVRSDFVAAENPRGTRVVIRVPLHRS